MEDKNNPNFNTDDIKNFFDTRCVRYYNACVKFGGTKRFDDICIKQIVKKFGEDAREIATRTVREFLTKNAADN